MTSAVLCSHCQRNAADTFLSGSALCHYCAQVSFQHNTPCVVCSHKKASSVCTCEFPLVAVCEDCSNSHRLKVSSTGHVLQPLSLLTFVQSNDDLYRFQSRLTRIELMKRNLRDLSLRKIVGSRAEFNLYTQELAKSIESFAADIRGQLDRAYGQIEGVINALEKLKFDFYKAPENLFEDFAVNDEAGALFKSSQEAFQCIQFSISSQLFENTLRETVQFALTIPQVRKGLNQADLYYQDPVAVASWGNAGSPQVISQEFGNHSPAVQERQQPSPMFDQYQPDSVNLFSPYLPAICPRCCMPFRFIPENASIYCDICTFEMTRERSCLRCCVPLSLYCDSCNYEMTSAALQKKPNAYLQTTVTNKRCAVCLSPIFKPLLESEVPPELQMHMNFAPYCCSIWCLTKYKETAAMDC